MAAPRRPLAEIDGNRTKGKDLTPYKRGLITGAANAGQPISQIHLALGIPNRTIRSTLQLAPSRQEGQSLSRSSRPRKYNNEDETRLLAYVREFPRKTWFQLKRELLLPIKKRTIQRILSKHHIKKWLTAKRPFLKPEHAIKRLLWCTTRID